MALRPTLLQYAAVWIQLLPPLAGVATGRLHTAARRWTAVWCLGLVVADNLGRVVALLVGRNLWLTYLMTPATASTGLWALSCWQRGSGRLALRVAIPLLVLVGVVLTVRAEDFQSFSLFVIPFYALVLLLAAAWTFIRRSFAESALLLRQDWFWCVGEATVRLRTVGGMVELAVEDRGRGFDPGARRRDAGLGLISMTERAELVGGHASVRAQPGRGTSVIARVPNGGGPA